MQDSKVLGFKLIKSREFWDGHSAVVTCYVAEVDVEWPLTYEGHYYINFLLR